MSSRASGRPLFLKLHTRWTGPEEWGWPLTSTGTEVHTHSHGAGMTTYDNSKMDQFLSWVKRPPWGRPLTDHRGHGDGSAGASCEELKRKSYRLLGAEKCVSLL